MRQVPAQAEPRRLRAAAQPRYLCSRNHLQQTKARTAKQAAVRALRCIAREIMVRACFWRQKYATINTKALFLWIRQKPAGRCTAMPNREGGYGGYQSSQPQQNRMPRKVNAPGSGKVRRGVDPAGLGAQRPRSGPPARRSSHRSRRAAAIQRNARRPSRSPCTGQHPARSSGRPIMRSSPTGAARRIPAYVANRACRTGG